MTSVNSEYKFKTNNDNGQDDLSEKMNESKVVQSEAQVEKLDSDVEHNDLGKMNGNKDSESQAVESADLAKLDVCRELESKGQGGKLDDKNEVVDSSDKMNEDRLETNQNQDEIVGEEEEPEPVFDGIEVPGMEANRSSSRRFLDHDPEVEGSAWPEKAMALKNLVKVKSAVAVNSVLRRLSGKKDENGEDVSVDENKLASDSGNDSEAAEVSQKMAEISLWNPLNYIKKSSDVDAENKDEEGEESIKEPPQPLVMRGRILLYTRLGCQDSKEARLFLYQKRLRYVEINIDVYPGRKLELEKIAGSSAVPKVFFNEILIGGLSELKGLDVSGRLEEKIEYLVTEVPSVEAPLPPLSGEDDVSCRGAIDELAVIVRKMKAQLLLRTDSTKCAGSPTAVEFGRKLASKLFFKHVLDENLFDDGDHLYRFLDHDPIVSSQCHNIPRGIIDVKPISISEIASRLRFLSYVILEAYASEDGRHVDYRSVHGSEEFARYLRIIQELQRVELQDMPREEKLAFFINLYNMMTIHAILVCGYPIGALERRKLFGDFKYVIGGCTYSLSAIQNGILRCNQRPPYNLMKPFSANDKRLQLSLPYPEPLIHFALVSGNRSSPALRCYSPGNIDKELMEAARDFVRGGELLLDLQAKVASISKIFKWFSMDFGKNEVEVLKHASNYLEPAASAVLLELLASSHLKVIYQPYDWRSNC
ncbi:hypothetical protein JRO89_XS07G0159600 [Xanthoceras sorbifolium]|uniref:Electron transporter n=1 Tax=Xanthoceras sorbifolium TaxID=99658 RepID=A0ABQ8HU05_9ROSI|nr:hypothetical protein JRO89_XS07G0159600 [Xanthoceras sorbifolium]